MKKVFKYGVFILMLLILSFHGVYASSTSISSSSKNITKNSPVTIYVTVSSDSPLVSVEGSLSCSGAGVNSGLNLVYDDSSNGVYSKNYSLSVKPTTTGTITCNVSGTRITNMSSGSWIGLNSSSVSINVSEAAKVVPKTYSSDNNLKSLSIDGYNIDFNKDTLEYSIEVENNVSSVNINASASDAKASISGAGEKNVSEGSNKLEVVVTAENGNTKTYVINVNVKELDPIYVKIEKNEYSVIRKDGLIDPPCEYFEKTSVKIGDDEVLGYYNKKAKITLVALKDKSDKINYYIYKNNKYTLYKEYNFGSVILFIIDSKKNIPQSYFKSKFNFNDDKINGYKLNGDSDYYLVYAMNVENGVKGLYSYDSKEKTIQRYNDEVASIYKNKADKYYLYFIISLIVLGSFVLTLLIIFLVSKKKRNKYISSKSIPKNIKNSDDINDILVKSDHKKKD